MSLNQVLSLVSFIYPYSALTNTCKDLHKFNTASRIRSLMYCKSVRTHYTSISLNITSWLVPEISYESEFQVILINHTSREVLICSVSQIPHLILGYWKNSAPIISGSNTERRFLVNDKYEIVPLCTGINRQCCDYNLLHL